MASSVAISGTSSYWQDLPVLCVGKAATRSRECAGLLP